MKRLIFILALVFTLGGCTNVEGGETYTYCNDCGNYLNPFDEYDEIYILEIKGDYAKVSIDGVDTTMTESYARDISYDEEGDRISHSRTGQIFLILLTIIILIFLLGFIID
jgi:hypothetical protein